MTMSYWPTRLLVSALVLNAGWPLIRLLFLAIDKTTVTGCQHRVGRTVSTGLAVGSGRRVAGPTVNVPATRLKS